MNFRDLGRLALPLLVAYFLLPYYSEAQADGEEEESSTGEAATSAPATGDIVLLHG